MSDSIPWKLRADQTLNDGAGQWYSTIQEVRVYLSFQAEEA